MQTKRSKALVVASYVLIVGGLSAMSGVTSAFAWLVLAALTVGPPVVFLTFWKDPSRSMSESIQAARR